MSDLIRYRIDYGPPGGDTVAPELEEAYQDVEELKRMGVLVPDSTLQAIADAWNAHKRVIDASSYAAAFEGSTLAALLDALVEEPIDTVSRLGMVQDAGQTND